MPAPRQRSTLYDRWSGAAIALMLLALIAHALRPDPLNNAPPETCQPPGTLTKVTL